MATSSKAAADRTLKIIYPTDVASRMEILANMAGYESLEEYMKEAIDERFKADEEKAKQALRRNQQSGSSGGGGGSSRRASNSGGGGGGGSD